MFLRTHILMALLAALVFSSCHCEGKKREKKKPGNKENRGEDQEENVSLDFKSWMNKSRLQFIF